MRIVLRNAEIDAGCHDVTLTVGDAAAVLLDGERLATNGRANEELVLDAAGGALLPGLHDHHVHLLAMAATSIDCRTVTDAAGLGELLRSSPTGTSAGTSGDWVRATGYHESIAGDLDRHALDRLVADRPVRVQHTSGALWMLNSRALQEVADVLDHSADVERDATGAPTGRLWRYDARLRPGLPPILPDLSAVGDRLLRLGITGVTDATPDLDPGAIALLTNARRSGALPQDLVLLGAPDDFVDSPWASAGPAKLLLRDHDLPDPDAVAAWIAARHATGRPVAVHCVTSDALVITLAALEQVGTLPGDRLEHASIVPPGLRDDIARLGLRVVTNPGFLHARGDAYLADVASAELPFLYPYRSLAAAGITVAAASDAPYGDPDPWQVIRAATTRTTSSGRALSPEERVSPYAALTGYLSPASTPGTPAGLDEGQRSGLCLLRRPLGDALEDPGAALVRLVVTDARIDTIWTLAQQR